MVTLNASVDLSTASFLGCSRNVILISRDDLRKMSRSNSKCSFISRRALCCDCLRVSVSIRGTNFAATFFIRKIRQHELLYSPILQSQFMNFRDVFIRSGSLKSPRTIFSGEEIR